MATMEVIEQPARECADALLELAQRKERVDEETRALWRSRRRSIKFTADKVAAVGDQLTGAIDESGALFGRPRNRVFHGV